MSSIQRFASACTFGSFGSVPRCISSRTDAISRGHSSWISRIFSSPNISRRCASVSIWSLV
jgi:hypothetical protein